MLSLAHILQLGSVGSHVSIVLVLPNEGNNQILPRADTRGFQIGIPDDRHPGQAFLEEMHKQFLVPRVCPHFSAIHLQVIFGASGPLVFIKIWYLELWRDDNIRYQTQFCHVSERVITKPFDNP